MIFNIFFAQLLLTSETEYTFVCFEEKQQNLNYFRHGFTHTWIWERGHPIKPEKMSFND